MGANDYIGYFDSYELLALSLPICCRKHLAEFLSRHQTPRDRGNWTIENPTPQDYTDQESLCLESWIETRFELVHLDDGTFHAYRKRPCGYFSRKEP